MTKSAEPALFACATQVRYLEVKVASGIMNVQLSVG